jgi:hypothetical protein
MLERGSPMRRMKPVFFVDTLVISDLDRIEDLPPVTSPSLAEAVIGVHPFGVRSSDPRRRLEPDVGW